MGSRLPVLSKLWFQRDSKGPFIAYYGRVFVIPLAFKWNDLPYFCIYAIFRLDTWEMEV